MPQQDYSRRTVCVVDNGLFSDLALGLTRWFGRVLLYVPPGATPWPTTAQLSVGQGLHTSVGFAANTTSAQVEKIDDLFAHLSDVDLFVFPDIYHASLQSHLRNLGCRVFGSGYGEDLELDRFLFKLFLEQAQLPVGKYETITGVDDLRRRLTLSPGVVKISRSRGDFETFFSKEFAQTDLDIDSIAHGLGPFKDFKKFLVEEPLPVSEMLEIGYDGFMINGEWTSGLLGLEMKDKAYVGRALAKEQYPPQLAKANDAIAPMLAERGYKNAFSSEVLVERPVGGVLGAGYFIDPCCRFGSPPGAAMMRLITNLADILWFGAVNVAIDPVFEQPWVAQLQVTRVAAREDWTALSVPDNVRSRVFVHWPLEAGGQLYAMPMHYDNPAVCAVVGAGDSLSAAVEDALAVAEQITGHGLQVPTGAVQDGADALARLGEYGIQLPA